MDAGHHPPRPYRKHVGRYELISSIGVGAAGEVWEAWDPSLQRRVALKLLTVESPEALARFLREGRIIANLSHPNIPRVYEVGEHENRAWLALEYIKGGSLEGCTLERRRAAGVVRDAALAVQHAHEAGIVHRDIKPANVLLSLDGTVFVLDFGLARMSAGMSDLTRTGAVLGTPGYMSPEQARGQEADERSDVYGLGALLYALLQGHAPFRGRHPMDVVRRVAATLPEPLPEVDDLARIGNHAMARERHHRFASAVEMAQALEHWLAGGSWRRGRRRWWPF